MTQRIVTATVAGIIVALAVILLAVFTMAPGNNDPKPIPLFGISADQLAKDGVYVYPAGSGEHMDQNQAQQSGRGLNKIEDPIKGTQLVRLVLPSQGYDALTWAIRWDVDGKAAYLPGGGDATYDYSLTFVNAMTGEIVSSVKVARPQ